MPSSSDYTQCCTPIFQAQLNEGNRDGPEETIEKSGGGDLQKSRPLSFFIFWRFAKHQGFRERPDPRCLHYLFPRRKVEVSGALSFSVPWVGAVGIELYPKLLSLAGTRCYQPLHESIVAKCCQNREAAHHLHAKPELFKRGRAPVVSTWEVP